MKKLLIPLLCFCVMNAYSQPSNQGELYVKKCQDFSVDGSGKNEQWSKISWVDMPPLTKNDRALATRFKILYSEKGIYVLAHCEDQKITTDYTVDQGDIWNGDVFEVFLQTDPDNPLYFEYEINPLNVELVILVPNNQGDFFGWSPWHYEGDRLVKKGVQVHGGRAESGAAISGWTAEMFFPFALFKGLKNIPPSSETVWKGNFYRMDYDTGERELWAWKPVTTNFHEYASFGTLVFE